MTDKISIVLVDDHSIVRRGLISFLEAFDDLEVIGDAASGEVDRTDVCAERGPLLDRPLPAHGRRRGARQQQQAAVPRPGREVDGDTIRQPDRLAHRPVRPHHAQDVVLHRSRPLSRRFDPFPLLLPQHRERTRG